MVKVVVSREGSSGLVAVALAAARPGGLPSAVRVLEEPLAALVVGMLEAVIAEARARGGPVLVDLDELVERAEVAARGRDRRVDPGQ